MTSNFQELNNIVLALEDCVANRFLLNSEIFLYTDNTTAERAYYKGNSPSKLLFGLVQ